MSRSLTRRTFLGAAATAATAASLPRPSALAASTSAPSAPRPPKSGSGAVPAWPMWDQRDEQALLDVLRSGKWGRGSGGARNREFEETFSRRMQARHCVSTASGTTALLTALGALNIGPGDEVVLSPYTFVATFNVITANFALPIFADSDIETFQVDPATMASAITPATKLLLPVHIGGTAADLDALTALASTKKIPLIEDACQAPLAEWRGRPVGTAGLAGCFSFQASKNLNSGEGGAVITNDEDFATRCYNFHTPTGAKAGATGLGRGSNFRLTEFQAALLLSQWTRLETQARLRDENAALLSKLLSGIPGIAPARLLPGNTRNGWHLYMFRYDAARFSGLSRAKFIQALAQAGVAASTGYGNLNNSTHVRSLADNPHYVRIYGREGMARWLERTRCPVNDRLVDQGIWFSQATLLAPRTEIERIAETIAGIQRRSGELARA